jgi:anti-sigma factor RsiW
MTCEDVNDLIEPIAAGDLAADAELRAHLAQCAGCAAALARAAALHRLLASQPDPAVPADFVPRAMARVRRDRWRSEQMLDTVFNVVVAAAVLVGALGLYAVLAATGVSVVGADVLRLFVAAANQAVVSAAPQAGVYGISALVLVSGLAFWWWAERGLEF